MADSVFVLSRYLTATATFFHVICLKGPHANRYLFADKHQLFQKPMSNMLSYYHFTVPSLIAISLFVYLRFYIENTDTSNYGNLRRPEVRISHGKIEGVNIFSRSGRKILSFMGIPFAQPPVGNLRFKAPVPSAPWNDTFDGSMDSKPCPQLSDTTIIGNEDCLYVNVYTPRLPVTENSTLMPVMVYIFGGGFTKEANGLKRFHPRFILDKDLVLVIPNFRLGVLGFLSTGDEISPGNYGLKDLVLALEWTRDNIRYFGGDPNQVTLVGASSGAMSVHLLTLSNLTEGLFHRYITQSGSALAVFSFQSRRTYAKHATRLGEYLGCPTDTSAVLVDCLRGFNASQLVDTIPAFRMWNTFPAVVWGPTVEPEIEGAILTDNPRNLFAAGKVRDLPWLESVNRDEGTSLGTSLYEKPDVYMELLNNLDTLLPIILQYENLVDDVTSFTDALKSYYMNDLTADPNLLLRNFTQLMGDYIVIYPTYRAAQQQLIHAKQPHYLCSFEYRGPVSYSYMYGRGPITNWDVAHGDELLYLFPGENSLFEPPGWEFNENDWRMVDTMVQLWTSFIIDGTPTIPDLNGGVVWKPYSSRKNYLRIGSGPNTTIEVGYNLLLDRMRFWEALDAATSWRD